MHRIVLPLAFLLLSCSGLYAQLNVELPRILQPNPDVAQLTRFTDYGLDYRTGTPSVNIPIYHINAGMIDIPISISYNSTGRKAFDESGLVAIGWSLNAGGSISRVIKGAPDSKYMPATIKTEWQVTNQADYEYLSDIYYKIKDGNYDIYTYNIPGESGKFIQEHVSSYIVRPFKRTAVKIVPGPMPTEMYDGKGNYYYFGEVEKLQDYVDFGQYNTCNLLTSIISADKKDTVNITYVNKHIGMHHTYHELIIRDNYSNNPMSNSIEYPSNKTGYMDYDTKRIKEIRYRGGKVEFVYNTTDSWGRIEKIVVYDAFGKIIRQVRLTVGIMDSPSQAGSAQKYKLTQMAFQTATGQDVEKYSMDYAASNYTTSNSRDYWGYFNGRTNSTTVPQMGTILVSGGLVQYNFTQPGNRSPSDALALAAEAGCLTKITHPTGGITEFSYEANYYRQGGTVYPGPGVRVKEIKLTDNTGNIQYKTYKYGSNEDGVGSLLMTTPYYEDMSYERYYFQRTYSGPNMYEYFRARTYSSEFCQELQELLDRPLMYGTVTEYNGTIAQNAGKTMYYYSTPFTYQWSTSMYGSFPPNSPQLLYNYSGLSPYHMHRSSIWQYDYSREPRLGSTEFYKKNTDGSFTLVRKKSDNYILNSTTTYRGVSVFKFLEIGSPSGVVINKPMDEKTFAEQHGFPIFEWKNTELILGDEVLDYTLETEYTPNGNFTQKTSYTYNDKGLPVSIVTEGSNSQNTTQSIKYPADLTGDAEVGSISTQMVTGNMLNYPIEVNSQRGSSTEAVKTVYSLTGSRILPATVKTKRGAAAYENRLQYTAYDNRGNIASVKKEADLAKSYIWNYKGLYPVAEATNAAKSDIGYLSFEGDDWNGWTGLVMNNFLFNEGAVTGRTAYTLRGAITKSGLSSSTTYKVVYWIKGPACSVMGSPANYIKSKNGWNCYEHTISAHTSCTIANGDYPIDEIRIFPVNAAMVTRAYDPGIGIISECDENNRVNYFYYDSYGRLSFIKDEDGNVLKTVCYTYYGMGGEVCGLYGNTAQSGSYTKTNCSPGYAGTQVTYTVPANTFYANTQTEANQKAAALVTQYGQGYANLKGNCNPANVVVTGNSYASVSCQIHFTNQANGQGYDLYLTPGGSNSVSMPTGTYNVYFTPGSGGWTFNVNGYTQYGASASFSNIAIGTGSYVRIN